MALWKYSTARHLILTLGIMAMVSSCMAEIPKERYYPEPGEICKQDYYMTMEDVRLEEDRPVCEPCKDGEVNEHPESSITCHEKQTTTTTTETEPPPTTSKTETTTTPTTTTIENQTTRPQETPSTTAEVTTAATEPSTEGEPTTHQPEDENDTKNNSGGEDKSWTLPWWGGLLLFGLGLVTGAAIDRVVTIYVNKINSKKCNEKYKTKPDSAEDDTLVKKSNNLV